MPPGAEDCDKLPDGPHITSQTYGELPPNLTQNVPSEGNQVSERSPSVSSLEDRPAVNTVGNHNQGQQDITGKSDMENPETSYAVRLTQFHLAEMGKLIPDEAQAVFQTFSARQAEAIAAPRVANTYIPGGLYERRAAMSRVKSAMEPTGGRVADSKLGDGVDALSEAVLPTQPSQAAEKPSTSSYSRLALQSTEQPMDDILIGSSEHSFSKTPLALYPGGIQAIPQADGQIKITEQKKKHVPRDTQHPVAPENSGASNYLCSREALANAAPAGPMHKETLNSEEPGSDVEVTDNITLAASKNLDSLNPNEQTTRTAPIVSNPQLLENANPNKPAIVGAAAVGDTSAHVKHLEHTRAREPGFDFDSTGRSGIRRVLDNLRHRGVKSKYTQADAGWVKAKQRRISKCKTFTGSEEEVPPHFREGIWTLRQDEASGSRTDRRPYAAGTSEPSLSPRQLPRVALRASQELLGPPIIPLSIGDDFLLDSVLLEMGVDTGISSSPGGRAPLSLHEALQLPESSTAVRLAPVQSMVTSPPVPSETELQVPTLLRDHLGTSRQVQLSSSTLPESPAQVACTANLAGRSVPFGETATNESTMRIKLPPKPNIVGWTRQPKSDALGFAEGLKNSLGRSSRAAKKALKRGKCFFGSGRSKAPPESGVTQTNSLTLSKAIAEITRTQRRVPSAMEVLEARERELAQRPRDEMGTLFGRSRSSRRQLSGKELQERYEFLLQIEHDKFEAESILVTDQGTTAIWVDRWDGAIPVDNQLLDPNRKSSRGSPSISGDNNRYNSLLSVSPSQRSITSAIASSPQKASQGAEVVAEVAQKRESPTTLETAPAQRGQIIRQMTISHPTAFLTTPGGSRLDLGLMQKDETIENETS